jgi:transposase-like protein
MNLDRKLPLRCNPMKCKHCGETNLGTDYSSDLQFVTYSCKNCNDSWTIDLINQRKVRKDKAV